jgi:hypothetical protein
VIIGIGCASAQQSDYNRAHFQCVLHGTSPSKN